MAPTAEERISKVERQLLTYKVASSVFAICLSIFLYVKWQDIPQQIDTTITEKIGADVTSKANEIIKLHSKIQDKESVLTKSDNQKIDAISEELNLLRQNKLSRCKIEQQSEWRDSCSSAGAVVKTDWEGGWSDWNITSEWDGTPWSCLRLRIQCE